MILYILISVVVQGLLANAQNDTRCQTNVNTTLDQCLSSFIYKWDDIRKVKPQIDALVYPLWTMTSEELRSLCLRVEEAQEQCGMTPIDKCDKNEVARFVQQNFIYACNSKPGSLFADSADCLLSTINSKQECLMLLKKTDDDRADGCSQLSDFFKCIHDDVQKACKARGVAALVHGIDRFGCDVGKLDARIGAQDQALPNCLPPDWQAVTNCFQPLLNMWAEIRDNDTSLLETAFPVFKFERADVAKMCEMVHGVRDQCSLQIQRCPSHQLPEFTNSILGLACGTQQAVFFLSYDCIKRAIIENTQCHAYTVGAWQPGHLKEACGRMPQFYKCLEKPVQARCANDGVNVLAQAIRQFGCELNVDPLPPGGTTIPPPTTAPTTTTLVATASQTTTIPVQPPAPASQVAGPPGSNTAVLAPATNIFSAASGSQQALPAPAPAPFLNAAPVSPPPLVPGPQEPLFNLPVVAQQQQAPAASAVIPAATHSPTQAPITLPTPAPPAPITQAPAAPAPAAAPAPGPAPAPPAAAQSVPTVAAPSVPIPTPALPAPSAVPVPAPAPAPLPAAPVQPAQPQPQPQTSAVPAPAPAQPQPQPPVQPQPQQPAAPQVPAPAAAAVPAQPQPQPAPAPAPAPTPEIPTTTAAPTPLPGERKSVQPIPLIPHLLQVCDIDRRNAVRKCLHPLFKRWVGIHTRMITETYRQNLTFPIYHYARSEVMELCDQYATAFLQCPFSVFQECLRDEVVFLANAILGYTCSPQNLHEFTRHFDCISTLLRARNQCTESINGPLLIGRDEATRCTGVKKFYECNKQPVKETCTSAAERVFKETVRQFGCELGQ